MLEVLLILFGGMDLWYFFDYGFCFIVHVGLAEGGIGTTEIIPDLLHELFTIDVFCSSEGKSHPSVAYFPFLANDTRLELFSDDVAFSRVVMVFAAL